MVTLIQLMNYVIYVPKGRNILFSCLFKADVLFVIILFLQPLFLCWSHLASRSHSIQSICVGQHQCKYYWIQFETCIYTGLILSDCVLPLAWGFLFLLLKEEKTLFEIQNYSEVASFDIWKGVPKKVLGSRMIFHSESSRNQSAVLGFPEETEAESKQ